MKKFLCYDTNDAASGKIGVDSRGILKPNSTVPSGSAPYQQLVTDGDGNAKWEDKMIVDIELSDTSTNPVQNKVIKSALDSLSGGLIVNLTKDETNMEFTSSKRAYTADRTPDDIYNTIFSGKNIILLANYIEPGGHELQGVYHLAGFYNGQISFICVMATGEGAIAIGKAVVGYDTIIFSSSGHWTGSYTNLQNSSEK